jgi:hypothetical protein
MKVQVEEGKLIDFADLEVKEVVAMADNARVVATEWRHNGKLVRRDVHVIVLRHLQIGACHGE